ncbi:Uncharacterised protein [Vibrio cholerae]|nr:Uncharacterised protein [Vibrio cholerae]
MPRGIMMAKMISKYPSAHSEIIFSKRLTSGEVRV